MKGHSALPGVRAMPDISVIGPLARSATDLRTSTCWQVRTYHGARLQTGYARVGRA